MKYKKKRSKFLKTKAELEFDIERLEARVKALEYKIYEKKTIGTNCTSTPLRASTIIRNGQIVY